MTGRLMRLDRNRLGVLGIALAVDPVPRDQPSGRRAAHPHAARPDRGPAVHALGRHARGAGRDRRADRSAPLLHRAARRARARTSASMRERVEELLGAYRRLSGGKLRIERLDPAPFSPEEDLAVAEGLEGLPISDDGTLAYFGLTGRNSTDDQRGHRLSRARARQLPRVRPDADDQRPRQAREAGGRGARRPAADGRADQPLPAVEGAARRCISSSTCASSAASRRRSRTTSAC